ncbi:SpoIID/LytB domain-containing protein [Nocardia crassostreae]|uniref:SpoIID/LytB domain-containing protein n=1 Tax=Nocardia crassostreae TaxID=53428 RepID=UPI00082DB6B5|nr:SpoIID/LytB domain-containing protein [Nocardia crassostreae]
MPKGHLHRRRRRRRLLTLSLTALTLATSTGALLYAWPGGIEFRASMGPGHGRGLSQNGAYNQAQDGSTAESILAHYYPGASLTEIAPVPVRVRLMAQDDSTLDVESESGLLVAGRRVIPGQAAHLTPTPTGADVVITTGCDGEVLWEGATDDPWVYPIYEGPDRPAEEHLTLCGGSAYRGALGVALDNGAFRTINYIDIDDYLQGVVPAEMVPNWADQGGTEALRAQAIAARSYALAESRYPYAETCDTTDCQAYPGTDKEDPRTTAAVHSTTGQILALDGHVLRAGYSAGDSGSPTTENLELGPAVSEFPSAQPQFIDPTIPVYPNPTLPAESDPTAPVESDHAPLPDQIPWESLDLGDQSPQPVTESVDLITNSHDYTHPSVPESSIKPAVPSATNAPGTASTPTPPLTPLPLLTQPTVTSTSPR